MQKLAIISFLILGALTQTHAQTNCGINYHYDNAGNRIERIYQETCGVDGGLPGGHKKEQALTDSISTPNLTEALFPNPSSGMVNIVFNTAVNDAQLTVTDNLGRQVYATVISGTSIPVDISRLPNGVYYVTVKAGGDSFRNALVRD